MKDLISSLKSNRSNAFPSIYSNVLKKGFCKNFLTKKRVHFYYSSHNTSIHHTIKVFPQIMVVLYLVVIFDGFIVIVPPLFLYPT